MTKRSISPPGCHGPALSLAERARIRQAHPKGQIVWYKSARSHHITVSVVLGRYRRDGALAVLQFLRAGHPIEPRVVWRRQLNVHHNPGISLELAASIALKTHRKRRKQ